MKKISAKKIYTLTTDPIPNGVVVVGNDNKILDILRSTDGLEDIEYFDGYITPAFINAHCHIELSHLKNKIEAKKGLLNFIKDLQLIRNSFDKQEILQAIENAEQSMINNGIVAVGDISNSDISFLQKSKNKLKYHNFIEVFGLNQESEAILKEAKKLLTKAPQKASITPHAPYTVSKDLFKAINLLSDDNTLLSIHNQESNSENTLYESLKGSFIDLYKHFNIDISKFPKYNNTSIKTYLPWLKNGKKLLVHNTFTNKSDVNFIKQYKNTYLCLCPNANLYIENRLPDINMLTNSTVPIVLGTDSLASNTQLCIFSEILTIKKHFKEISLQQALIWACKNSAEYFGYEKLGSIEIGKSPGLLNINLEKKEVFLITKANF